MRVAPATHRNPVFITQIHTQPKFTRNPQPTFQTLIKVYDNNNIIININNINIINIMTKIRNKGAKMMLLFQKRHGQFGRLTYSPATRRPRTRIETRRGGNPI